LIEASGIKGFENDEWSLRPVEPHISARAIFLADGRSASAVETVLHMIRVGKLGVLVGETTGGTNGSPTTFESFGFQVRFTEMRTPKPDGTPLQGRGFTPDVIVHPTKEGTIAGRDELLEAAVELATKP
jgi:C-terminal processing protease CtpA/Prc